MTKQLTIPTKTRKPSKSEIVDALVRLRVKQMIEQQSKQMDERAELEARATKLLSAFVSTKIKTLKPDFNLGRKGTKWCDAKKGYVPSGKTESVSVRFELSNALPDDISKILLRIHSLPDRLNYDEKRIRREIIEGLDGTKEARVDELLRLPEFRTKLEAMLEAITT